MPLIPEDQFSKSLLDADRDPFFCADINDAAMSDLMFVPRLGPFAKEKLNDAGITTVKQLIGMFLVKQTPDAFKEWLEGTGVQASTSVSGAITIMINNYCAQNNL